MHKYRPIQLFLIAFCLSFLATWGLLALLDLLWVIS